MKYRLFTKTCDGYQHRARNKNRIMVHLIFTVKYRKRLLHGAVRDSVLQSVYDTCRKKHWYIICMETDADHLHILLQYNQTDSITKIVSALKQYSTYNVWKQRRQMLTAEFWKEKTFWSDGYFAASVGQVSQAAIERYIETQG